MSTAIRERPILDGQYRWAYGNEAMEVVRKAARSVTGASDS